jgi:CHAT domain-containing protein/Tfp pilus assembly protein PilF
MQAALITVCVFLLLTTVGSNTLPGHHRAAAEDGARNSPTSLARPLDVIRDCGVALAEEGRFAEAAAAFEQGYRESLESESTRHAVRFLTNLANVQFKLAHYREAMRNYLEARELAEISGDREMAGVLSVNIFSLYITLGAFEEAGQAAREVLEAMPPGGSSKHLPEILALRARLYALQGEMDRAIPLFRQAIQEADRQGDLPILARTWNELGYESLKRGDLDTAQSALVEAFRLMKMNGMQVPDRLYQDLGLLRMAQGDLDSASRLLEKAFTVARTTRSTLPVWSLHYRRAQVRAARGRLPEAYLDLKVALACIRDLRLALLPADSVRAGAGVRISHFYDFFIKVAARLYCSTGRSSLARQSFEAAEENRAAALRESLGDAGRIRRSLPARYWETLNRLSEAETSLFRADTPAARRIVDRLRQQLTEMEFQAGLRLAGEAGTNAMTIRQAELADVQRALGGPEALFSFHLSEPNSYLWAVTPDCFELHLLPGREQIGAQVKAFRAAVEKSLPEAAGLGEKLHAALFGDVGADILGKPDWVLILDGSLFELPFPALVVSRNEDTLVYLPEKHSLRVLPAAAMLIMPPEDQWRGPLLAVSDPVYNPADPRWEPPAVTRLSAWRRLLALAPGFPARADTGRPFHLARLAGSARETRACAEAFASTAAPPILLTGTRAGLLDIEASLAAKPSVVHFATHVVPSLEHPDIGHIALSLRPDAEPELLSPTTVAALGVNSGLIVMSGCSSGSGKALPGEGLWGLTRAWLRAGAHNVAATFWPTPDHSGELLQSFYRHLGGAGGQGFPAAPEKALQLAQLDMLRSGTWRSRPSYWAAYFLVCRN